MKLQYLISDELTTDFIGKALMDFQSRKAPALQRLLNYYNGKQKITRKQPSDVGKPSNIIISNYCRSITDNYKGYLAGIPVTYSNDNFQEVIDILRYNDVAKEDAELLRQALIYGRAFEICYIDEDGKQRFKTLDTRECVPVYSNSLNGELLHVIRFYREDLLNQGTENYIVEVYSPSTVTKYRSAPGFTSFTLLDEEPHFYGQCPVTVFSLNEDEESIFAQIISLQDAYNEVLSGGVDDFSAFADAYLVLKGVIADEADLVTMKTNRVLMVDTDASAEYLTKTIDPASIEFLLTTIKEQIHTISNSPDFTDKDFMASSGIALKYKLVGLENAASGIEGQMKMALQRRIELLCSILSLTNEEQGWRDVKIAFTRNLPQSLTPTTVSELMAYKGLVSDATLLELVPFVDDPEEEMKLTEEQRKKEESDVYNSFRQGA